MQYLITLSSAVPEMVGATKIEMVHVTWPCPFQGCFVILGIGLAIVNLSTKFAYDTCPLRGYENGFKMWKMGWFGVTQCR